MKKDTTFWNLLATMGQRMKLTVIATMAAVLILVAGIAFLNPIIRGGRTALDIDGEKKRVHLATSSYREPNPPTGLKVAKTTEKSDLARRSRSIQVQPDGTVNITFAE